MTRRCCSNCDYWFRTNPIQIGGQCRRYAPRSWDKDKSAIPQTVADYWCGDFAEKRAWAEDVVYDLPMIEAKPKRKRIAKA